MPSEPPEKNTQPPIILLHGFRGSPLGLASIADQLKLAGYQVHTPAVPPFAGAEYLNVYGPDHYAEFVKSYITGNQLDHPILIGHSMGSIIAAATANHYPEFIDGHLILLSPISARTPIPIRFISSLAALLPKRLVDYATTKYLFVPTHNRNMFRSTLQLTHLCSHDHPPRAREVIKSGFFSTKHSIADFRLPKKTLFISGEKDRLIKQSATQKVARQKHADLILLSNTGHLHNYEQPLETADAIISWLDQELATKNAPNNSKNPKNN